MRTLGERARPKWIKYPKEETRKIGEKIRERGRPKK